MTPVGRGAVLPGHLPFLAERQVGECLEAKAVGMLIACPGLQRGCIQGLLPASVKG
jgi:hypothetical protein